MASKLTEIFGTQFLDGQYKRGDKGEVVSLGKDEYGNEIEVKMDWQNSEKDILPISPEILAKIKNNELQEEQRQKTAEKKKKILDSYFKNTKVEGTIAEDFDKRPLFQMPEAFLHMMYEEEDEDEELDPRSRSIIKTGRKDGTVVTTSMMHGLKDAIDVASKYKNMIWVRDFLLFLKDQGVNFRMVSENPVALAEFHKQWKALRRPAVPNMIQRLLQEADDKFFKLIDQNPNIDKEMKRILKVDTESRVEFVEEMRQHSGENLYTMEDFVLQKFHFEEYGFDEDDAKWFNPNTPIPSRPGVNMGHYLNEFERRTGIRYEDIYYYYWKIVKEEQEKKSVDEAINKEDFDEEIVTKSNSETTKENSKITVGLDLDIEIDMDEDDII